MIVCFYANWVKAGTDVKDLFYGWWVPEEVFKNDYAHVQVSSCRAGPIVQDRALSCFMVSEQAVGILGAVIMPHNIYLHSALVQSRCARP